MKSGVQIVVKTVGIKDKDKDKDNKENIKRKEKESKRTDIYEIYNRICTKLPRIQKLTEKRKKAIDEFIKEFTIEQFEQICQVANSNAFLTGENDRKWKADFDFLMRIDKATGILEGKYNNLENISKNQANYEQRQYDNLDFLYANFKEEKRD